jgi:sugar O-acyltransferase (sialic acid O-acetyltransferase NeuD family)
MFAIFGTGGMGRELVGPAKAMLGPRTDELRFVVDHPQGPVMGIDVIAPDALTEADEVVVAIGDSAVRKSIAERLRARAGTLVAPNCLIGPDVEIGEGAVLCDFSIITASVRIGRHFQCNIHSYVTHDCVIGDYVTFAPRVGCNGNVHIGDGAYIGAGAVLKQGTPSRPLVIGRGAVVGMGAVVTRDVPDGAVVVGNPARPLQKR